MSNSGISDNIKKYWKRLEGTHCHLVAISKTKPNEAIMEAYQVGQRVFGENKVQELAQKYESLPKDIEWHMVGHLQRNKVKYIAPFVHLIHSVDSIRLLEAINKEGIKNSRKIPILLQVYIAKEETKFGFTEDEIWELIRSGGLQELEGIEISGLMGMASNTPDVTQVGNEFKRLQQFFVELKEASNLGELRHLSMGMSNDFEIAIEYGATLIRIGTDIFGARNYGNQSL